MRKKYIIFAKKYGYDRETMKNRLYTMSNR